MKIFIKLFLCLYLCAVLSFNCINVIAAETVTVASECDISDIDEPIVDTGAAAAIGEAMEIKAKSAVLMEVGTGKVLYEMNADEQLPPASVTKVMSLLLFMRAIDNKQISVEDVVTVSEHAAGMGGSQIWLKENESMTVDDLLKAAVIASANDATVALAETVAGSEEGFVALMNKTAGDLGLGCRFKNSTGLDAEGHLMSAGDIAVISKELIKFPLIKKYSTVWMESLRGGKTELVNTNKLVRFYDGATGLKTGTTSKAGCCLSATAERNGLSLVAVVMAGENSKERFAAAKKLLDYGFANYAAKSIPVKSEDIGKINVKDGVLNTVEASAVNPVPVLLKKGEEDGVSVRININKNLTAPIKKGEVLGTAEVTDRSGNTLAVTDITAKTDVDKKTFWAVFLWVIKGVFTL